MNVTSFSAEEYNLGIRKSIPYYDVIQDEVLQLIESVNKAPINWLDLGCGSGHTIRKSIERFSDTNFFLGEPAEDMLGVARKELAEFGNERIKFLHSKTQDLDVSILPRMDIVTASLVHHFCNKDQREQATKKVYDSLQKGGVYLTVEIIRPNFEKGIEVSLQKLGNWEKSIGKTDEEVEKHLSRYGKAYFPISIQDHLDLLKETGFETYNIFWLSNLQAAFYAVK